MKLKAMWIWGTLMLAWGTGYWWWATEVWPNPYLRLVHTLAVVAILFGGAYLSGIRAFRWRVVCCAGFALAFVAALRCGPSLPYTWVIPASAANFLFPAGNPASSISMREAWRVLRNSRQRQEDRARAIIAAHVKKYSV
jgi:hypothetical protein